MFNLIQMIIFYDIFRIYFLDFLYSYIFSCKIAYWIDFAPDLKQVENHSQIDMVLKN